MFFWTIVLKVVIGATYIVLCTTTLYYAFVVAFDEAGIIANRLARVLARIAIVIVAILAISGITWGLIATCAALENWAQERGFSLFSCVEESKLISDAPEKGSKIVVVDENGEMHEYYILAENDKSSDSQEDSDDTEVRYFTDGVTITKGF